VICLILTPKVGYISRQKGYFIVIAPKRPVNKGKIHGLIISET
jgi:hypothetical protein